MRFFISDTMLFMVKNIEKYVEINKNYILQQYDERLKILHNNNDDSMIPIDEQTIRKWKLDALDKFMKECGNATDYTATVSQYFTIPELFALRRFMYKHDARRMLQMAHQRYQQTGLGQWKHDEKWNKYCQISAGNIVSEWQYSW